MNIILTENSYYMYQNCPKNLPSSSLSSVITPFEPTIDSNTFKSLSVIVPNTPRLTLGYLTVVNSTLVEYFATLEKKCQIMKRKVEFLITKKCRKNIPLID